MESQSSDFSIDHILNRAGDKYVKLNQINHIAKFNNFEHIILKNGDKLSNSLEASVNLYDNVSSNSGGSSSGDESSDIYEQNFFPGSFQDSERFLSNLNFDWLHYTRYRPPRLPSECFFKVETFIGLLTLYWNKELIKKGYQHLQITTVK